MSEKSRPNYEEAVKKEFEITKQLALAEVREWIEKIPEEERDKPAIVVATKVFTPRQLVKEVEEDTEYGRRLVQMLTKVRLELAKKEG